MKMLKPLGGLLEKTAILVVVLVLFGCSSTQQPPPNPFGQQAQTTPSQQPQQQAAAPQPPPTPPTQRPMFYDFPDIPVPSELSIASGDSYVFQSGALKAGLLTLKGRVELNSLINFFQMALPREGWKPKGGFRYRRSVLIFEKPDKICVINLYEKLLYSYVEIYVAPAGGQV